MGNLCGKVSDTSKELEKKAQNYLVQGKEEEAKGRIQDALSCYQKAQQQDAVEAILNSIVELS